SCSGTPGTITFGNLTLGDGSTTITTTLGGTTPTITVAGLLTITTNETFNGGTASNINLTGNGTVFTPTGTFTPATSTVNFNSAATTGTTVPRITYYNIVFNKASNTFTAPAGATNLVANHNMTITAGTLDLNTNDPVTTVSGDLTITGTLLASNSATLTVAGNWVNNGTFTHNSGTVAITPATSSSVTGSSATTFQNLTISAPDKTVLFKAGQTVTVGGTLTLAGTSGHNLIIGSTVNSSAWTIVVTGSFSMNYLSVSDSICGGGTDFTQNSTITNVGNNGACWHFTIQGGSSGGGDSSAGSGSSSSGGGGSGGSGGGSGGSSAATATASVSGGVVISVTVVTGGAGYTTQPSVCFVGTGTGAIAAATISGGVVISISVSIGGTGYSVAPTVTVAAPDVGGACSSSGGGGQGGGGGDAP
ncbi:MAG TPA: hypothetical protein VHQ20_00760, partial [Patescibacteria group bacterium]|nr:hypothetical protein [Patescibacteria group bacterium]